LAKKGAIVSVKLGGRIKTSDQLIRKFNKKCKQEKIVNECRKRSFYKSKSQKRRDDKAAGRYRAIRRARKKQSK
jgi:ribosomal protein S21